MSTGVMAKETEERESTMRVLIYCDDCHVYEVEHPEESSMLREIPYILRLARDDRGEELREYQLIGVCDAFMYIEAKPVPVKPVRKVL
jgi:hypothetical protein